MVLPLLGVPIWLILLTCFMAFVVWYSWDMSKDLNLFERMGISGPPPMPIIGNFGFRYWWNGMFKSQVDIYQQFKDKKFYGTFDAKTPVLNISDCDAIKQILLDHSGHFSERPNRFHGDPLMDSCLYSLKRGKWRKMRDVFHSLLDSRTTKFALSVVQKSSNMFMNFLKPKIDWRRKVELTRLAEYYVIDVHSNYTFGRDFNVFENTYGCMVYNSCKLLKNSRKWRIASLFFPFASSILRMFGASVVPKSALKFFDKRIKDSLEKTDTSKITNKRKENDCFVSSLESSRLDSNTMSESFVEDIDCGSKNTKTESQIGSSEIVKLTELDIKAHTFTLLHSGLRKVSTILSLTLFQLANNPTCCEKVQHEIDDNIGKLTPDEDNIQKLNYLDQCICETIRMFPSYASIDRICTKDINILGVNIPSKMIVRIPVYALHNDPDIWTNPDKFVPERFDTSSSCLLSRIVSSAFMPFGKGSRSCVGMHFAMMEMKIVLVNFLKIVTPIPCQQTKYPVKMQLWKAEPDDELWVKVRPRFWL